MDWPVTFKTTNGLRFRVDHVRQPPPPRKIGEAGVARPTQPREPVADALAVHVEGRGWHVMGTYGGEEEIPAPSSNRRCGGGRSRPAIPCTSGRSHHRGAHRHSSIGACSPDRCRKEQRSAR